MEIWLCFLNEMQYLQNLEAVPVVQIKVVKISSFKIKWKDSISHFGSATMGLT